MGRAAAGIDIGWEGWKMLCRFTLLRRKEVINLCDGCRLGCVGDVEVQIPEGTVKALIVFGPCRFSGCSDGERIFTSRGSVCRSSGTTSYWWISRFSGGSQGRRRRGRRGGFRGAFFVFVSASAPLPLTSATVEAGALVFQSKSGSAPRSRDNAIFR